MSKAEHLMENTVAKVEDKRFDGMDYIDILDDIKADPNFPNLTGAAADELAKDILDMANWVVYTYKPSIDI